MVEAAPASFEEEVKEAKPLESQEVETAFEEGKYITCSKAETGHNLIANSDFAEKPTVATKPVALAAAEVIEHAEAPSAEEVTVESAVETAEVTESHVVEEKVTVSGTKMEVAPAKPEVGALEAVKDEAPLGKQTSSGIVGR